MRYLEERVVQAEGPASKKDLACLRNRRKPVWLGQNEEGGEYRRGNGRRNVEQTTRGHGGHQKFV